MGVSDPKAEPRSSAPCANCAGKKKDCSNERIFYEKASPSLRKSHLCPIEKLMQDGREFQVSAIDLLFLLVGSFRDWTLQRYYFSTCESIQVAALLVITLAGGKPST